MSAKHSGVDTEDSDWPQEPAASERMDSMFPANSADEEGMRTWRQILILVSFIAMLLVLGQLLRGRLSSSAPPDIDELPIGL